MKKAYILLLSVILLVLVAFWGIIKLQNSSYVPREARDSFAFIQARLLLKDSKELAKYFLFVAHKQGRQCLNSIHFNFANALVRMDYYYALGICVEGKLKDIPQDTKQNAILVSLSVIINASNAKSDKSVNDEVFLNDKFYIYPEKP